MYFTARLSEMESSASTADKVSKLHSEIANMKRDYDNWSNILEKSHLKEQNQIKLWEKAMEKVQETVKDNRAETTFDVRNDENEIFLTIAYTPTQSKCIKIKNNCHLKSFTLPEALEWIQTNIAGLEGSIKKIVLDQNYVSCQQEKLYWTQKYLSKGEKALPQVAVGTEEQTEVNGDLVKTPNNLTELVNPSEPDLNAFMVTAEEDTALINNLKDEVLGMLSKLMSLNSEVLSMIVDLKDIRNIEVRLLEYNENKTGGTKNGVAEKQSDLSKLSDDFSGQVNSSESITKKIESNANYSGENNYRENYCLHLNFFINPANKVTISSIDFERKENTLEAEEETSGTQPIEIRTENESDGSKLNSEQNSNSTQHGFRFPKDLNGTQSLECDLKDCLDQYMSGGMKTLSGQKESAPEKIMKHNESSEGMCTSKCENDLVSCPPINDILFDSTEEDNTTGGDPTNINLNANHSNGDYNLSYSKSENLNDNAGDTIINDESLYKLPDVLRDYNFENTVNEKNYTESPSKSISKKGNSSTIKIEIESGTERKNSYISDTPFAMVTIHLCNDVKNSEDSFDLAVTDDMKSIITKNKTYSGQNMK
ncbi:reticulocyte-binding protein PFD0110w [Drosophila simulans]|nr:reticulocyte-binding protein PFD0110w [Drosophila simulans]